MGNRTSEEAPRNSNYNTLNRSNRSRREERRQKQRKVLVLICLVFILLLCLYLFLIFSQIASTARNNRTHQGDTQDTKDSAKQTDDTGSDTGDHPLPPVDGYVGLTRTAADIHTGNLLQLDASHPLNDTAQKSALMNLKAIPTTGSTLKIRAETDYVPNKLMPEVIDALTAMISAMQAEGLTDLSIVSAYKPAGTYAPYRTGYAVGLKVYVGEVQYKMFDVQGAKCRPEYGEWLLANSCKYGFLISDRDTGNEQAFRYYGIANATYMKEHGLEDLEDYLSVLRSMTSAEGTHLQISANGSEYECYYVPANASGNTTVQVPADNDTVTVSGDNVSGFVVSYKVR